MEPVFLTKVLLKCVVRKFVGCVIGACDRWIRCCMVSMPEPRDWSDRKKEKFNDFFNRLLWRLHVRVLHLSCSTSLPSRDFSFFSQSEFLMPSWEVTCHFNLCEFLSWEIFLMVSFLSALFWEFPFLFGKARFMSERFSFLLWKLCWAVVVCIFGIGSNKHTAYSITSNSQKGSPCIQNSQLSKRIPSERKLSERHFSEHTFYWITVSTQNECPQKENAPKGNSQKDILWNAHVVWIGCVRKNIF